MTRVRILDISRLVRRAGRPMTGIDRVEYAYLRALSARRDPFFGIARTRLGYVLLDHDGARDMARRLGEDDFGPLDLLGRAAPQRDEMARRAEADLRRLALARCLPQRLGAMLSKHLQNGAYYLNIGHSNFTPRMISALRSAGARIGVMIHDVIPVEAPHWQRDGVPEKFHQFLRRVSEHADLVIYNSEDTRRRSEAVLPHRPKCVVAHLGVEVAQEDLLPPHLPPKPPFFVTLGTIEPRKNHLLLLDIWEEMGSDAPHLLIIGNRGWNLGPILERLAEASDRVIEVQGLSDGAVTALLKASNGLLFPSQMEGFGLPPMEAAALNVPVLCQPLPVLREVMGDIPIYAKASDPYHWRKEIENLAEQRHKPPIFVPPSWTDHFNTVLMLT